VRSPQFGLIVLILSMAIGAICAYLYITRKEVREGVSKAIEHTKTFISEATEPVTPATREQAEKIIESTTVIEKTTERIIIGEFEKGFPSDAATDEVNIVGAVPLTAQSIKVQLPEGATIVKASCIGLMTAMNHTANLQKVDLSIYARKAGEAWAPYWSAMDALGLPNVDGATASVTPVADVSALVTDPAGTYEFQFQVVQSAAYAVRYTTQFILLVAYKVG